MTTTPLPAWLDQQAYPFQPKQCAHADGKLSYVDEGSGPLVVFVHGTPTWSFLWRTPILALRERYRCIAPDHLGFGLSDKPANATYTVAAHTDRLADLLAQTDGPVHLVVHDFGGPIGLGWALRHPARIRSLTLLNTGMWDFSPDPSYRKALPILKSPLLPLLYRQFNFSPRLLLPQLFANKRLLKPAVHAQYRKPFPDASSRNGALGFARSLVHELPLLQAQWEQMDILANNPTLLVWGMQDKTFGADALRRWQAVFAHQTTVEVPHAGHFVQEEAPEVLVQALEQHLAKVV